MPATDGTWRQTLGTAAVARRLPSSLAACSAVLMLALGLFVISRRAAGAFLAPSPIKLLLATACVLVVWAWLVRLTLARQSLRGLTARQLSSPDSLFGIWLPFVATCLFAVACSSPGERLIDWLVWPATLFAIVLGPRFVLPWRRRPAAAGDTLSEGSVLQELTRYRTTDGLEGVRGMLLAEFAPGERNATLFVAFCPPFERLPVVEAQAIDGPPATLKLAQVLHNGAQIEVRLSGMADCQHRVTVRLLATESLGHVECSQAP